MNRWQHLNDLCKTIIALASALLVLAFSLIQEDLNWNLASWFLSGFYIFLVLTISISLYSMATVSNILTEKAGRYSCNAGRYSRRAICTANASFFSFALAMLSIAVLGVAELFCG